MDHNDGKSSFTSDVGLLKRAERSADEHLTAWIRSVLREAAIQGLQEGLRVTTIAAESRRDDGDDDGRGDEDAAKNGGDDASGTTPSDVRVLEVTGNDILAAQNLCRRVADAWRDGLLDRGHRRVADLVRRLVETELETLFFSAEDSGETATAARALAEEVSPLSHLSDPERRNEFSYVTSLGRLRSIGRRGGNDILAETERPKLPAPEAIRQLDDLVLRGQSEAGLLGDWNAVQRFCDVEVPSRLHNAKRPRPEIELIPKSVWEKQQKKEQSLRQMQQESLVGVGGCINPAQEEQTTADEVKELVLRRKRKTAIRPPPSASDSTTKRRRGQDYLGCASISPFAAAPARPANDDDGEQRWRWKRDVVDGLSNVDRAKLDRCLHDTSSQNCPAGPPPAVLLGALRDTGRFHHWIQSIVDRDRGGADYGSDADEEIAAPSTRRHDKRAQRKSVKERLGGHVEVGDYGQGPRSGLKLSRVTRAVEGSCAGGDVGDDDSESRRRHWLHLDLGHCLFEWPAKELEDKYDYDSEQRMERKLYYFDSLEAILLDEDSSDDPE